MTDKPLYMEFPEFQARVKLLAEQVEDRGIVREVILPIVAELAALGFFLSVVALWAGVVSGAI